MSPILIYIAWVAVWQALYDLQGGNHPIRD